MVGYHGLTEAERDARLERPSGPSGQPKAINVPRPTASRVDPRPTVSRFAIGESEEERRYAAFALYLDSRA